MLSGSGVSGIRMQEIQVEGKSSSRSPSSAKSSLVQVLSSVFSSKKNVGTRSEGGPVIVKLSVRVHFAGGQKNPEALIFRKHNVRLKLT